MTGHSDPAAAAFEQALLLHAHDAPAADGLLERVRVRIDRRRRNRRIGAGLLAAAAVAGIVALVAWMAGGSPLKRSEPAQPPTPAGWRWESSRGVEVLVPLRHTVMDSLRPVGDTDVYGCPVRHPIADYPDTRPFGGGLATVGDVNGISVCSYTSELSGEDLPPLLDSSRLTGTNAQKRVDAILTAPEGIGPEAPAKSCRGFPGGPYGYQKILLIVHGSQRDQEVVLRFGGCKLRGTDDGQVERKLTADVLRPLVAFGRPNMPYYGLPEPIWLLVDR
jgi:hypothetical protein